MDFNNVTEYLTSLGLKPRKDFSVSADVEVVEFNIDFAYFCSVGKYDNDTFEVYEQHHGAEVSAEGHFWLTDGELWQYKLYSSLKRAIDFAVGCLKKQQLPTKPIKVW